MKDTASNIEFASFWLPTFCASGAISQASEKLRPTGEVSPAEKSKTFEPYNSLGQPLLEIVRRSTIVLESNHFSSAPRS